MKNIIKQYLNEINKIIKNDTYNEHTFRTPFENLFKDIFKHKIFDSFNYEISHESKNKDKDGLGTPDFDINQIDVIDGNEVANLKGFIECKKYGVDIDKEVDGEQIKKYSIKNDNIILTNYRDFILVKSGNRFSFNEKITDEDIIEFQELILEFLGNNSEYIINSTMLVREMATRSKIYANKVKLLYDENEEYKFKVNEKIKTYKEIFHIEYDKFNFFDDYSQTLVFGLFLARLNNSNFKIEESINFIEKIPAQYKILQEYLHSLELPFGIDSKYKKSLISLLKGLNAINIVEIQNEALKNNKDYTIHLYEDFLKEYNHITKKERGVFYTPKEVVDFINIACNYVITDIFGEKNLLSDNIKILDFATGTGTFLLSNIDLLKNTISNNSQKEKLKRYILNNIYGFEILFTPYIMAHMLMNEKLNSFGLSLKEGEDFNIYLTNGIDLDDPKPPLPGTYQLSRQNKDAYDKVKNSKEIISLRGNPPYKSGKSTNSSSVMYEKMLSWYGKRITDKKELNTKEGSKIKYSLAESSLATIFGYKEVSKTVDIYLEFLRLAELKAQEKDRSVDGFIVNNSFLEGLTLRLMRYSLLRTYDEIYILNLHGKQDDANENVFAISSVGVCVVIFVKKGKKKLVDLDSFVIEKEFKIYDDLAKVKYYSVLDDESLKKRNDILRFLETNDLNSIKWQDVDFPKDDFNFFFVKKDFTDLNEYNSFWGLTEIFKEYSSGIQTRRDKLTIYFSKKYLDSFRDEMINEEAHIVKEKYEITESRDWKYELAKEDIKNNYNPQEIHYRPFDIRWTSLSTKSKRFLGYSFYKIMRHFDNKENLGLVFTRGINLGVDFKNIFISDKIIDINQYTSQTYLAPLYIYEEDDKDAQNTIGDVEDKSPNFTPEFKSFLKSYNSKNPEDIIHYIYAVMQHSTYRSKYIDYLKSDFPKVPFTKNKRIFENLVVLGKKLSHLHTFKDIPSKDNIDFEPADVSIENLKEIHYQEKEQKIALNKNECFLIGVSQEMWSFKIGSYQVIKNYLDSRKGLSLKTSDINKIVEINTIIEETLSIQNEISSINWNDIKKQTK